MVEAQSLLAWLTEQLSDAVKKEYLDLIPEDNIVYAVDVHVPYFGKVQMLPTNDKALTAAKRKLADELLLGLKNISQKKLDEKSLDETRKGDVADQKKKSESLNTTYAGFKIILAAMKKVVSDKKKEADDVRRAHGYATGLYEEALMVCERTLEDVDVLEKELKNFSERYFCLFERTQRRAVEAVTFEIVRDKFAEMLIKKYFKIRIEYHKSCMQGAKIKSKTKNTEAEALAEEIKSALKYLDFHFPLGIMPVVVQGIQWAVEQTGERMGGSNSLTKMLVTTPLISVFMEELQIFHGELTNPKAVAVPFPSGSKPVVAADMKGKGEAAGAAAANGSSAAPPVLFSPVGATGAPIAPPAPPPPAPPAVPGVSPGAGSAEDKPKKKKKKKKGKEKEPSESRSPSPPPAARRI